MRIVNKPIFYCDFCGKYRLTKYSMQLHEKKCLLNKNRICNAPYCLANTGTREEDIDYVCEIATSDYSGDNYGVSEQQIETIRNERVEGCPICTISILMLARNKFRERGNGFNWYYDIKPIARKMYDGYYEENFQGYY